VYLNKARGLFLDPNRQGGSVLVSSAASAQYLGPFGWRVVQRRSAAARGFLKVVISEKRGAEGPWDFGRK